MATLSAPYVFHEDAFYEYFKPVRHSGAKHKIWGGLGLETFGEDFDIVRSYDPLFVWTVADGDSGDQWITAGVHYVNRVCYLIAAKPHDWIPAEFRIRDGGNSLKPFGLTRQLLKLERLFA